jgi:hypothetical protein
VSPRRLQSENSTRMENIHFTRKDPREFIRTIEKGPDQISESRNRSEFHGRVYILQANRRWCNCRTANSLILPCGSCRKNCESDITETCEFGLARVSLQKRALLLESYECSEFIFVI